MTVYAVIAGIDYEGETPDPLTLLPKYAIL